MAALTIAGVDFVATLGFNMTSGGTALDAAVLVPGELTIPTMPGAIIAGPGATPVREFTIEGYFNGASQAAVRTNLHKAQALIGSAPVLITLGDWSTVGITAQCVKFTGLNYPLNGRGNSQNEIPIAVTMTFRAQTPFWSDLSPQSIGFTTSAVAMPQGTAPGEPVLTCTAGAITTPVFTCKDYTGATLWTATFGSLLIAEQYRITTALGTMTIEKFTGGVWTNSDASLTAGTFPAPLPSDPTGYQTAAWPTLQATTGTWTAAYPLRWR